MAGDPGFIHAPSVMQAQTAALLRNAHLNHSREDAQDLFAVDLSSRRVRLATTLLDGVRQGQPLGAVLGYLFERKLHEFGHDADIDEFRAIAPLRAGQRAGNAAGRVDRREQCRGRSRAAEGTAKIVAARLRLPDTGSARAPATVRKRACVAG